MGKFVISVRNYGTYHFILRADNGETILVSERYTGKSACRKGIQSVMKNSLREDCFDRRVTVNDKAYFNVRAGNGKVIATSEQYESSAAMEKGIKKVKEQAPAAKIIDETLKRKPS